MHNLLCIRVQSVLGLQSGSIHRSLSLLSEFIEMVSMKKLNLAYLICIRRSEFPWISLVRRQT